MPVPNARGVEGFVKGLESLGFAPEQQGRLLVYTIQPMDGALAGCDVATGVDTEELTSWPVTPPHWVHLPETIPLAATNWKRSPLAGWIQHSRKTPNWGTSDDPARDWVAHVRGVVGEAT